MMSLEDLSVVVAVARHGSFIEAARRTRVPTSTVSRAVARFEEGSGVRLFQRTSRRVTTTEEGARLLEQAAPLLDELGEVVDNLSNDARAVSGRLRVTAPVVSGAGGIGDALLAFAEAHPRVAVELTFTNTVVDLIADGIDLAFRAGPVAGGGGADLVQKRVSSVPFSIGASRGFLVREHRGEKTVDRDAIARLPAVVARPGTSWRFRKEGGDVVEVQPRSRFSFLCQRSSCSHRSGPSRPRSRTSSYRVDIRRRLDGARKPRPPRRS